tara:strand:+ start:58782 stop:58940 length:159 start_codon:yes stop_codon:yes gene_type:complete
MNTRVDEQRNALEAHIVLNGKVDMDELKPKLKSMLYEDLGIEHSTLEFELKS